MPAGGRALVLGSDTRSFLSVIRSLGRAGVEVHAGWAEPDAPALHSRYVAAVHDVPPFRPGDDGWLEAFTALLREREFDVAIPCHDSGVLALHHHRKELGRWTRLCIPNESAYEVCADKRQTYELAQRLCVPLPAQVRVESVSEIRAVAARFGLPLVLKPAMSVSPADPGVRNEVQKIRGMDEIEAAAAALLGRGPLLVQQNFIGVGVGVEVLCREGEVLTAFQHERVHEPLAGGGSSYRKSVPLAPRLLDATCRLMKALRYTGVAMAEFKVNPRTEEWVLIEINPRFWGSLPLTVAAGADFPRYLYEMTVLGRRDFRRDYRTGLYCRNWRLDVGWMRRNLAADRRDPMLLTLPLWKVALEPVRLFRERSDTLATDDPGPALAEVSRLAACALEAASWKVPGLRARMRYRVRTAVREGERFLVVCKGNICRSPFAEAYLRRFGTPNLEVRSAGYYPSSGRTPPEAARQAALRFGLDLTGHRSRTITRDLVDWADVILVFEPEQYAAIRSAFPKAVEQVHYLGAIGRSKSPRIRDPWGGTVDEFLSVYREIKIALDQVLRDRAFHPFSGASV